MPGNKYDPIVDAAGAEWNVDPNLIRAVMGQESGGRPVARSKANAQGLMQIIPETQRYLGVTNPYDPVQSIFGGAKYLSEALDNEKSPEDALRYYHGGPSWRTAYGPESQAYVPGVAAKYRQIVANARPPSAQPTLAAPAPATGQDAASGAPAVPSAKTKPDTSPDESGEDILQSYLRRDAAPASRVGASGDTSSPAASASTPAATDDDAAAGDDILQSYTKADAPAVAAATNENADQPTSVPAVNNLWAGVKHGAMSVFNTGSRLAARVDAAVPALNWLDQRYGLDPQTQAAGQPTAEAAYQAKYGNSNWATAGNVLGQAAVTTPLLLAGGGVVGAVGGATAEGLGGAATMLGRGVQAGTDLVTGTASAPGAGVVGRTLARGTGMMTGGAVAGGATAAMTGEDIPTGAMAGGVAGPVVGGVGAGTAAAGRLGGKAVGGAYNALTGANTATEIENALAPGRVVTAPASVVSQGNPLAAGVPQTSAAPAEAATATATPEAATAAPAAASRGGGSLSAEMKRFQAPPPSGPNDKVYIAGVTPTEAEIAGNANTSRAQAVIYDRNPEPFDKIQDANTAKRIEHYNGLSGDADTLQHLEDVRAAQAKTDLAPVWANKKDVDAQPVLDSINKQMAGPDGKLAPVRSALKEVADALQKSDGTGLETDPEMLYGARKQISYMLSKKGQLANPAYGDENVIGALRGAQKSIDGVIEPANPGYQAYLDNYTQNSKPIDTQEVLQKAGVKIGTNAGMNLRNVNNLLQQVVTKRQAGGISKEASIDPDTMEGLFNLRDDLARKANIDLGKSRGSGTNQNEAFTEAAGVGAAHIAASHFPMGNFLLENRLATVKGRKLDAWTDRLTNPPPVNPLAAGASPP